MKKLLDYIWYLPIDLIAWIILNLTILMHKWANKIGNWFDLTPDFVDELLNDEENKNDELDSD